MPPKTKAQLEEELRAVKEELARYKEGAIGKHLSRRERRIIAQRNKIVWRSLTPQAKLNIK